MLYSLSLSHSPLFTLTLYLYIWTSLTLYVCVCVCVCVCLCVCLFVFRGAFSEVYMVREKTTGNLYALKCLKKKHLAHSNLENEISVLRR